MHLHMHYFQIQQYFDSKGKLNSAFIFHTNSQVEV